MLQTLIDNVVSFPTEENTNNYLNHVNQTEYSLLVEAEDLAPKSQEYFDKRREAFAYRRECAAALVTKWVSKHKTTEGCPVSYADTLNIPFQSIKKPTIL